MDSSYQNQKLRNRLLCQRKFVSRFFIKLFCDAVRQQQIEHRCTGFLFRKSVSPTMHAFKKTKKNSQRIDSDGFMKNCNAIIPIQAIARNIVEFSFYFYFFHVLNALSVLIFVSFRFSLRSIRCIFVWSLSHNFLTLSFYNKIIHIKTAALEHSFSVFLPFSHFRLVRSVNLVPMMWMKKKEHTKNVTTTHRT